MKVTFRCKRSGNTVSFINESDIQGMRKHEGYEEVIGNEKPAIEAKESPVDNPDGSQVDEASNGENEDGNEAREEEVKVLKKRGPKPKNK